MFIPTSAREYYAKFPPTPRDVPYTYEEIGRDDCGRTVFRRLLDGKPNGRPIARLTYAEYMRNVARVRKEYGEKTSVEFSWFTDPFFRDCRMDTDPYLEKYRPE